jgi:hypothetical protein
LFKEKFGVKSWTFQKQENRATLEEERKDQDEHWVSEEEDIEDTMCVHVKDSKRASTVLQMRELIAPSRNDDDSIDKCKDAHCKKNVTHC